MQLSGRCRARGEGTEAVNTIAQGFLGERCRGQKRCHALQAFVTAQRSKTQAAKPERQPDLLYTVLGVLTVDEEEYISKHLILHTVQGVFDKAERSSTGKVLKSILQRAPDESELALRRQG